MADAAAELGLAPSTLHRWLSDGFIAGEQLTPAAPWRIRAHPRHPRPVRRRRPRRLAGHARGHPRLRRLPPDHHATCQGRQAPRRQLPQRTQERAAYRTTEHPKTGCSDHHNQQEEQCDHGSKNFRMSRSITQSVSQHRRRQAATASSADRLLAGTRSVGDERAVPLGASSTPGRNRLSDPVGHGGHTEDSRARPVCLRDLHRAHRRREVRPRRHPIPDLAQVALQILLEVRDRLPVLYSGRSLIRPDFLPRLPDEPAWKSRNGLPGDFSSSTRLLPERLLVDRTNTATDNPAPSLRRHYRGFSANTSRSASASASVLSASRVHPACGAPSRPPATRAGQYRTCLPRSAWKPQAGFTLSLCRAPPGQ